MAGVTRCKALAELLALLAPPACAACRVPLGRGDERLCAACVRALPWLRRSCPRCALPGHRGAACPAVGAPWPLAWAPLAYEGVARELVAALKFRGALSVADLMGAHMAATLPAGVRAAPGAIVPVPPHHGRRRARGYDPAGALAAALARRLGRPLVACLRRDGGARQVGAGRGARRRSRLAVTARDPPARVLLVDDVHTTGATLAACTRALAAAGVEVVAALSYARTL